MSSLQLFVDPAHPERGTGVRTLEPIDKGTEVMEYKGDWLNASESALREEKYDQDHPSPGCFLFYISYQAAQYAIDATHPKTPLSLGHARYVNHSRKHPNLTPRLLKSCHAESIPRLVFIARRRILPGEELLVDYGDRSRVSTREHPWLRQ
jgi:SET domain-containing protein